jgi:hypothetical protein
MSWISFLYNDGSIILEMITVTLTTPTAGEIYFNQKYLGIVTVQEDGYFGYYSTEPSGYWSSYALRLIADKLDEMNKEWDEQVKKDIGNGK